MLREMIFARLDGAALDAFTEAMEQAVSGVFVPRAPRKKVLV